MQTKVSPDGQLRFALSTAERRRVCEAVALVGGVAGAIGDKELGDAAECIRSKLLNNGEWIGPTGAEKETEAT